MLYPNVSNHLPYTEGDFPVTFREVRRRAGALLGPSGDIFFPYKF
ncbi:Uncharacterised protein [Corynebacterium ulcerans]|uniref:Uncharacterized protein n=1 Tax=Corynebacterium ulcerans TaxID=65058 RepID=A0ABD7MRI0_CORUL|nr:Uncharacterised protein [Corynebacterium ulcerans]SQG49869.1 Uncharacterised protein [Corynebacterium ulcerans]SQH03476.1 Uncharacterised protein [Corynebacterium ulcerans]